MKIGIAGTGRMGTAIALRLLDKGHDVTVWNRTVDKTKAAADGGARVAATPAALARASDKVISMLTDASAMQAVYTSDEGLLSADASAKLFIEMTRCAEAITVLSRRRSRRRARCCSNVRSAER